MKATEILNKQLEICRDGFVLEGVYTKDEVLTLLTVKPLAKENKDNIEQMKEAE